MKKIICLSLAFWFCCACQKEDSFHYLNPVGGIQFDYKSMILNYDFAFRQDKDGKYLGDSIQYDTLKLAVAVAGYSADRDRSLVLDTVLVRDQDSSMIARLTFLPPYTFQANHYKDTVKVIIHRPIARGTYTVGVTFHWETILSEFEKGAKEKLIYRINVKDVYPKPENWSDRYFGEYTEEKYAFYVTIIGDIFQNFRNTKGKSYNQILRQALKKYNEEHPDAPKNFNFPNV